MSTGTTVPAASESGLRKELHDVLALLQKVDAKMAQTSEGKELTEKLTGALAEINEKLAQTTSGRTGQFDVSVDNDGIGDYVGKAMLDEYISTKAPTDEIRRLQTVNDDLYILGALLKKQPKDLAYFKKAMRELPILRKSLDTGSNGFANWVPTGFSSSLHDQVRLALRVAALHQRIDMPQDPYKLPVEGTDATAYIVNEQGDADANLDVTKMVTSSFNGAGATPGATVVTLDSVKIGARVTFSAEAEEDAIIPVLPYLRNKLALAMAQAQENATINGDDGVTHMDSDVTVSLDARKAWDGYRRYAIGASQAVTISNGASTAQRVTLNDLRRLRMNMGKYGIDPDKLVFITGPVGYIKMLQMEDPLSSANPSPVLTRDKYGDQGTVLTGEMAKVDGVPILVSPYVRENLGTGGVYTGGTVDRTMILCVNRDAFIYGDRRAVSLKSRDIIETDQTVLVTLQRLCFAHWFGTDPTCGYIYNVQR